MIDAASIAPPQDGLTASDHVWGEANAQLTLLEYGDYECPACIQAEPLVRHLVARYPGRICLVFRHFPLTEIHRNAELAAEAAEAAAAQGQFWPMHHLLFSQTRHLSSAAHEAYAQSLGLDMTRFKAEMADRIYTQRVQEHRRAGERSQVRATPSFFVNGQAVDVSFGFDKLDHAVQAGLQAGM
jgi:protein-disulfide isomerase